PDPVVQGACMRLPLKTLAGVVLALSAVSVLTTLPACSLFHQRDVEALPDTPPGTLPGLQEIGLHQAWQRQVRLEPGEQVKKSWYLGKSIYVATTESRILRIDTKNGVVKWAAG